MARIRTIKPEFFASHDVGVCTPLARLFYVFLWCEADRDGRLQYKPKNWRMRFFPADDINIESLFDELESCDDPMVVRYEIDGYCYVEIPSFAHHQVINNRESESIIPPRVKVACKHVKAEGRKEGKGKEGREQASVSGKFDVFWTEYPKKVGKDAAIKSWDKLSPTPELVEKIINAVVLAKKSSGWLKDGGQYIPNPSSWLNGRRWDDELPLGNAMVCHQQFGLTEHVLPPLVGFPK